MQIPKPDTRIPKRIPRLPRGGYRSARGTVGRTAAALLLVLAAGLLAPAAGQGQQQDLAKLLQQIGFDQRLDEQVPLELEFLDEQGRPVRLGDYFGDKPVILTLVYFQCPMLCTLELNGLVSTLRTMDMEIGREFTVLTVSFEPQDTPALAADKKQVYLQQYGREGAAEGWHFLTGQQQAIEPLTRAVGFRYKFDEQRGEYAHASGIVVLTPEGKTARYYYGIEYPARGLRLGLVEASQGKVGSPVDKLLLLCYGYDPTTGKYGLLIMGVIRLAGVAMVLALGGFIGVMVYRDYRQPKQNELAE